MTAEDLRKAEARYRRAAARADALRQERNEWVRKLLAEGLTHQAIADITGLSRGRINQLREGQ